MAAGADPRIPQALTFAAALTATDGEGVITQAPSRLGWWADGGEARGQNAQATQWAAARRARRGIATVV
jgi:hypothetical protein